MNIATTNAIAKIAAVVAGLGLVSMSFAFAVPAKAQSVDDLQSQINALLAQIAALQGGSSSSASTTFTMDLTVGSSGAEVTALQNFLISNGYSIPAGATGYFGAQTQAALAAFQAANGISPAAGYFGPITRAKVNGMGGGTTGGSTDGDDDDDFASGDEEGYLDEFDEIGTYSSEEVGEGEEDVGVLGVEMEAVDADQQIQRVTVEIDTPTGNDDLEDLITEVSLWLDGEELDRMDVDDAGYDRSADEYTFRFVNLDGVVSEGEVGELVVAVTGVNNLDTGDSGDGWTVTIPADGIRAVSPNGVDDTYDSSAKTETFTVETFASANDIELRSTAGDNNPDEGVVVIDDEGDEIVLLEGELKAEGSDMELIDLVINVVATNAAAGGLDAVIDELVLEIDGEEFSENVSTGASVGHADVTFDDLGVMIDEDDTITYTVTGKSATSSVLDSQDLSIAASTTVSSIAAEDSTGEDLASGDLTGSAQGETQHLFTTVLDVEVVSTDIDPISNGDAPAESALATIEVKLTALGGTIYLNGDDEATENLQFFVGQVYGSGTTASTTASSTVFTVISGENDVTASGADGEYYTLNEDETMTVRIESTVTQATVTSSAVLAGLRALLFQYGTAATSDATRSAIDLDWSDLTDQTQTGTESLVNAS